MEITRRFSSMRSILLAQASMIQEVSAAGADGLDYICGLNGHL